QNFQSCSPRVFPGTPLLFALHRPALALPRNGPPPAASPARCSPGFAARDGPGVPRSTPRPPAAGEREIATARARYRAIVRSSSQASLSLTTLEIAAESRFQLAASFSSCLWPSRVRE